MAIFCLLPGPSSALELLAQQAETSHASPSSCLCLLGGDPHLSAFQPDKSFEAALSNVVAVTGECGLSPSPLGAGGPVLTISGEKESLRLAWEDE